LAKSKLSKEEKINKTSNAEEKENTKNKKTKTVKTEESLVASKNKKESKTSENSSSAKTPKSKEPTTMEELLEMEGNNFRTLKRGSMVDGIVKEVNSNTIYIDVGAKTDGVVLGREFEKEKDFIKRLKPGDIVNAYVGSVEDERGQILLSLRKAASNFAWEKFEEMMKTGETIEIRGREINRGGLIVDAIFGLQGFVPGSQIGSMWQGKLEQLVGRTIITKVIEVNREQNRLVFSEKMVSDADKIAKTEKAIGKLKLDEVYEAEVTQIVPFGLFVKIKRENEEIEGLVHISEVSWQKVEDLNTLFKAKDKVKVKVINLDNNRVQFSIKQLLSDPWDKLEEKYPIDSHLTGNITRLTSFGALVQIEPGIEGLVHISKIPPELPINEGEELETYIESIDKKNRRISLGLVLSQKPIGYK
jgi:ribosomal protein S1